MTRRYASIAPFPHNAGKCGGSRMGVSLGIASEMNVLVSSPPSALRAPSPAAQGKEL
jgi:hypothetical protein